MKSPIKIYGKTERIIMEKTSGVYKGKKFYHDFKKGVQSIGLPRGTVIHTPDGEKYILTTRSALLTGKKDIWKNFPA